jgi:hypothetical protein
MARDYLKGIIGDAMNLLLAAAAYNFRKWMRAVGGNPFFALILPGFYIIRFMLPRPAKNKMAWQ